MLRCSSALALAASVCLAACGETIAADVEAPRFITGGQPDAGQHPWVGLLVFDDQNGPSWYCSGALLSPNVVLTAGHCTDGAVAARLWIDAVVAGNSDYPAGGPSSREGTPHLIPGFCSLCAPGNNGFIRRDVGIVVLHEPLPAHAAGSFAQLPAAGHVAALTNRQPLTLAGYGVRFQVRGHGQPFWVGSLSRHSASAELIAGNFSLSDEFLRISANAARGKGGMCFGDSGGPTMIAGTSTVLAVNSFVANGNCSGITYSQRIDIPDVLAWIQSFMD